MSTYGGEAGVTEFILGVVGNTLLIELALEVFQRQGIVKDCDVTTGRCVEVSPLVKQRYGHGGSSPREDGDESGLTHSDQASVIDDVVEG